MSKLVRILAVVVLAIFAAGTGANAAAATDMSLKMSMSSMHHGSMVDCEDSTGDDDMASSCDQFCLVTFAAVCTSCGSTALPDGAGGVDALIQGPSGDRAGPPDPYPPRTII